MPASEHTYQTGFYTNCLLFCLRNILIAIICLLVASLSFGWVVQKFGYFQYYSFVPGQYTGYKLHQLGGLAPERTCLILGASTAREGFDLGKLEAKFPELDFLTLATTAGWNGSSVIDIQASLIPKNKYACIIIGIHPFFTFAPDDQSYEIKITRYYSQIPLVDLIRMTRFDGDISTDELKLLGGIALVPNMRHAEILKEHLRYALHDLKKLPPSPFSYKDERSKQMPSFVKRDTEQIKTHDFENPHRYRSLSINGTLKMALKRLDSLSERLIIIDLPETPVYEEAVKASSVSFAKTVHSAVPASEYYQCEFTFPDAYRGFVDTLHVNSEGRRHLTAALIEILKGQSEKSLCSAVTIN